MLDLAGDCGRRAAMEQSAGLAASPSDSAAEQAGHRTHSDDRANGPAVRPRNQRVAGDTAGNPARARSKDLKRVLRAPRLGQSVCSRASGLRGPVWMEV